MKIALLLLSMAAPSLVLQSGVALAQSSGPQSAQSSDGQSSGSGASSGLPADNTKNNSQDPSNMAATADNQKNNTSDVKITQQIRRSIMADKSLSTYAHNAKIVTVNGTVTLNVVVHSDAEKSSLADKAAQVVGNDRVVNDLKVKEEK